jgi:hypothetical protein
MKKGAVGMKMTGKSGGEAEGQGPWSRRVIVVRNQISADVKLSLCHDISAAKLT